MLKDVDAELQARRRLHSDSSLMASFMLRGRHKPRQGDPHEDAEEDPMLLDSVGGSVASMSDPMKFWEGS